MKPIEMKISWKTAMMIYIECLINGTAEGKKHARKELLNLAEALDLREKLDSEQTEREHA